MIFKNNQKGFTLIELLVVVSIIGLLSSIVFASLNNVRAKARDVIRKQTLKQLQTALQLYYNDFGAYPVGTYYESPSGSDGTSNNGGNWIPGLAPTYISVLPKDPRGGHSTISGGCSVNWNSSYAYTSDGVNYKVFSHCAPEGTLSSTDPFYDPVRPTWAWQICTSPTACNNW